MSLCVLVISICSCYEYLAPCLPSARSANIPKPLVRMQIFRSRLAGERGQPGDECIAARSSSRASALLQVIGATPATFGTRKIRGSGRYRRPWAYAKSVGAKNRACRLRDWGRLRSVCIRRPNKKPSRRGPFIQLTACSVLTAPHLAATARSQGCRSPPSVP